MTRPIEIAENIKGLAAELLAIDTVFNDPVVVLNAAAEGIKAIEATRNPKWSNPLIWPDGIVPTSQDDVVVNRNMEIDLATCRRLDIYAPAVVTLNGQIDAYGSIVAHAGATLKGSRGGIYFHVENDRVFTGNGTPGPNPEDPDDHSDTDIGLWALEGAIVSLKGEEKTSWVYASPLFETPQDLGYGVKQYLSIYGRTVRTLLQPLGWEIGDKLLLVDVTGKSEVATLTEIRLLVDRPEEGEEGEEIRSYAISFSGADDFVMNTIEKDGNFLRPNIANLNRDIVIASADVKEGDTNHRAHTVFCHHSEVNLDYVEFRNLGPRGILGRYPVHFHHLGQAMPGSGIVGCSIWQNVTDPGSRFISVHNSQGLTVMHNVGYRSQGHGYFLEDGREAGNKIGQNLSVDVTGPEELPVKNSGITNETHHFWLYTGNEVSGNIAAGNGAYGIVILPGTPAVESNLVESFTAYGNKKYGMWSKTPNTTFKNCFAAYCGTAGLGGIPTFGFSADNLTIENPVFLLNGGMDLVYNVQMFFSLLGRVNVRGGVLAGKNEAIHHHYRSVFLNVEGTTIESDYLMHHTYWETAARFKNCQIKTVKGLFRPNYPTRFNGPGIVEIDQDTYVGRLFKTYPGFEGVEVSNAIKLLNPILAASGFIERFEGATSWIVTPQGQTPRTQKYIGENKLRWQANIDFKGYPDGFPPGIYEVSFFKDTTLLKSGTVEVKTGESISLT